MINLYDIAYGLGLAVAAPYWLLRPTARRKVFRAFRERMGHVPKRDWANPAILIHAVSLGEMNATRALVEMLQKQRPDVHFVISSTTDTGYDRGVELYGRSPSVSIVRYPLDFSGAVDRFLDNIRVWAVVLMELEVWPNFIRQCEKRGINVALANGRLTSSSFRSYRLIKPVAASMFRRLAIVCAQDENYAARFRHLGAPDERVTVTGTMKFDSAQIVRELPGAQSLAEAVGLRRSAEAIWVCGSTGPGEEDIALGVYRKLLMRFPNLRLVLVPRHPDRFDEVAELIKEHKFRVVRRSYTGFVPPLGAPIPPVILGDTLGELRKFYNVADLVFVGRTLVDQGPRQRGSDMIEPAALGKPVIIGPYTDNFAEAVEKFIAADAMHVVRTEEELADAVTQLIETPQSAAEMGRRAVGVVQHEQGATARNAQIILNLLPSMLNAEVLKQVAVPAPVMSPPPSVLLPPSSAPLPRPRFREPAKLTPQIKIFTD